MIELPWPTLAFAAAVVALAYVVYGLTGFGASIIAIPLLAHFFPLRFAVPMMLLLDIGAGLLLGLRHRRIVDWRELLRLAPWLLIGMAFGVSLLLQAGERLLLLMLGGFVLAYASWSLLVRAAVRPASTGWSVPAGLVGGAFTSMFGTGGPIYTIYLSRRLSDKSVLRASISMLILCAGLVRLAMFAGSGLYQQPALLSTVLWLAPAAFLGFVAGSRLHARLPPHRALQAVWTLLILGGSSLLVRAFSLG
jgi:uncharacterized membrane protein YfcA